MNNNKRPVLTELESIFLSILLPLPDHLTELSVVQLVVSAGIELGEGQGHLLLCQVLADVMKLFLCYKSVSIPVHALENLLYVRFLSEELLETQSLVEVSVHVIKEVLHLLTDEKTVSQ